MFSIAPQNILIGTILFTLLTAEALFPYFDTWRGKSRHLLRNGAIALINAIIANTTLVPLILWTTNLEGGLLNIVELNWVAELTLTILAIDGLSYLLHRMYHEVPFLWRFHKMHHSDTQMDVSTGARFHIGEHIISTTMKAGLFALCAIDIKNVVIYETLFIANVLFHHSNINITEPIDRIYRVFLTSPNMHKVHHSEVLTEANSNYTSLFSFWDRLFGTFAIIKNPEKIKYGVKGIDKEQSVLQLLLSPAKKTTRPKKR